MILCVLIPAYNEEGHLAGTLRYVYATLTQAGIPHHILVVNDNSTDNSEQLLQNLQQEIPTLHHLKNTYGQGFGNAVKFGLDNWQGDAVTIMMADASDSPDDLIKYYRELTEKKVDCVFGSRFIQGSSVTGYPALRLLINRGFNLTLRLLLNHPLNDVTNAFKAYRRPVVEAGKPYQSEDFSLTLELPLKALKNGYSYSVIPIHWSGRKYGFSKLNMLKNAPDYVKMVWLYLTNQL